jgi:AcrR family transcriptional regulator
MPRIKGRRPEDTREAILTAAVAVFGEVGYDDATLAIIARRAGVTAATLPYHFKDKQGLWDAVLGVFYTELMAFGRGLELNRPLVALLDDVFGWCLEHRQAIRVIIRNVLEMGRLDVSVEKRMGPALALVSLLAARRFDTTAERARDAAIALSHLIVRFVTNTVEDNMVSFGEATPEGVRRRIVGLLETVARALLADSHRGQGGGEQP